MRSGSRRCSRSGWWPGYGGAVGWGILGAVVGALTLLIPDPPLVPPFALAFGGALAGWIGRSLVGYFTGQLIKQKAPPLVARRVRRMGIVWSLGLAVAVAVATAIGVVIGLRVYEDLVESAEGFGEALGAILGGIVVLVFSEKHYPGEQPSQ